MSGRGYIPFSEVALYCSVFGYTKPEIREFWRRVHAVDKAYNTEYTNLDKAQAERAAAKSQKP